ncbi:BnaA06g10840D [Brassica napus]|uniref:BnaA06g10840D protein n=2 Tax=Brassica napus TaxID=3708 RepID=A0A078HC94_BRANA|nr:BnaA06g10840D [Brassica napus]
MNKEKGVNNYFTNVNKFEQGDRSESVDILKSQARIMGTIEQSIIPGLPDDLALRCISKLSHGYHGKLECVSKDWRDLVRCEAYSCYKARNGWSESWLFAHSNNQLVAYDPDADRWHPLPRNEAIQDGWDHSGFACVCVSSCLLVIGGCYVSSFPREEPFVVTNVVMRFDPFKKEWKMVAGMRTPRTRFACAAVSGKVYVAGGFNLTQSS